MSSAPRHIDDHRRQTIARAERRREMLERLAEQGMAVAGRLAQRAVAPEIGEEVAEVAEIFAKVSRAVRLTLILEARIDAQILAYRNGNDAAFDETGTPSAARGVRDPGPARDAGDRASDGDTEGDEFERLPTGDFKSWVAEICDDLDLDPDWSCWSDEEGFIGDNGEPVTDWPIRTIAPSTPAPGDAEDAYSGVGRRIGRSPFPSQPPSGEDRRRGEPSRGTPDG